MNDPLAYTLMEQLAASGRPNVRMDEDGTIMWDDPAALTGVQSLRPDMFANALARLEKERQSRQNPPPVSPPVPSPSRRRAPRLLFPFVLLLLVAGGVALVFGVSHKAPTRTPLGPDCKYDTVCLTTEINDANGAVDVFASSCNPTLLSGNAPAATAAIIASRCDTAVADRDRSIATAFVANATLQALSPSP